MSSHSSSELNQATSNPGCAEEVDRLVEVDRRLAASYGRPIWHSHAPPLDELIATVLSQHTSDINTARSFAALRERFETWDDIAEAPIDEIANAIRPGGLAELKAPRIQHIVRHVLGDNDRCRLDWLQDLPLAEARQWLLGLPGVGPKTAACVLLFSLGFPVMPVDTHVHRVSRRLGIVDPELDADASHDALDQLIGPDRDRIYALHLNLIRHGRETCRARNPRCDHCCLADICPSANKIFSYPTRG